MTPEQQAFVETLRNASVGQQIMTPSTLHRGGNLLADMDARISTLEACLFEIKKILVSHFMTTGL